MSDRAAAIELYRRQRDRTVVVYLPREGGIYRRSDIIDLVDQCFIQTPKLWGEITTAGGSTIERRRREVAEVESP